MKKVPEMISTKDLMYIGDMFNWHFIAAKKLELYLGDVNDEEIVSKIEDLTNMHYKACEKLIDLLKGGAK